MENKMKQETRENIEAGGFIIILFLLGVVTGIGFYPKPVETTTIKVLKETTDRPVYYDVEKICKKAGGEITKPMSVLDEDYTRGDFIYMSVGNNQGAENAFPCVVKGVTYTWNSYSNSYSTIINLDSDKYKGLYINCADDKCNNAK